MKFKMELTQNILKELLTYNPDTGIFTWNYRNIKWFSSLRELNRWNNRYANTIAGNIHTSGSKTYNIIRINYKAFKSHRLAFLYMNGNFPVNEVDHIDGNSLNNKWNNLRDVDHKTNSKNKKIRKTNVSGTQGVTFCNTTNKYVAFIVDNKGNKKTLGRFKNITEAIKIRKMAENKYDYHFNHGIK